MAKDTDDLALTLRALLLAALHPLDLDSRVDILAKAGWGNAEIGKITGLEPSTVGMRKLRNRKVKSK
jgi:hypothetical protein